MNDDQFEKRLKAIRFTGPADSLRERILDTADLLPEHQPIALRSGKPGSLSKISRSLGAVAAAAVIIAVLNMLPPQYTAPPGGMLGSKISQRIDMAASSYRDKNIDGDMDSRLFRALKTGFTDQ